MKGLFSEFVPSSAAQWKERIIRDLKGEVFENLIWKNGNGFDVLPFYTAEDLTHQVDPAFSHSTWEICASSMEESASGINRDLLYQLEKGATAITVSRGRHNYENLLRDIKLDYISSTFFCSEENLETLSKYLSKNYKDVTRRVNFFPPAQKTRKEIDSWVTSTLPLRTASSHIAAVDALSWFSAGALPYYEIALTLALMAEYLDSEEQAGISAPAPPVIRTGVDSDLFMQIAKLRALRRLWEIIKAEFARGGELYIIAETSLSNKSVSDKYNNLLRSSVEAFAAVAGGCNELVIHNFDALSGKPNKTASRLALNQQHILKEESYLDKMGDVGCGSYYIENITDQLAVKALAAFKDIMSKGGYFSVLESGMIDQEIAGQFGNKEEKVLSGEQTIVGVNKFRNEKETLDFGNVADVLKAKSIRNPAVNWELQQNLKKA